MKLWEMCEVDNCECGGAPLEPYHDPVLARRLRAASEEGRGRRRRAGEGRRRRNERFSLDVVFQTSDDKIARAGLPEPIARDPAG